ncbi:MAG: four-carbon acid sugar kinase family protein [Pseudomonadota bacterium]
MSESTINKQACLGSLPPEWGQDLMPAIAVQVRQEKIKTVILDDDPTGTQTVHGIPVLTTWDAASLEQELNQPQSACFILTNSRGLARHEACRLGQQIGENIKQASLSAKVGVSIISRSDSTLRGHFPHEVDAVAQAMGESHLPYLICPFFLEGGRLTVGNVHYVAEGESLVPAARTAYALDAAFGFYHSNLCQWVEEKTHGRIKADQVICITLDHIRTGGPDRVAEVLMTVPNQGACIVNAVSYRDVEVTVAGLQKAGAAGKRFLYRTAASFVRVRTGVIPKPALLGPKDLLSGTGAGGLFVVGSYVPKTTAQVDALIEQTDIFPIRISVEQMLNPLTQDSEIDRVISTCNRSLQAGKDTLVYTSRDLVRADDPEQSLQIGQQVSQGLVRIVQQLACQPRYLLAKGGITSSDVATRGLGVKRAMVTGQALPGVPVWELGPESRYPGMHYIIFPGNVGTDDALALILKQLDKNRTQGQPC